MTAEVDEDGYPADGSPPSWLSPAEEAAWRAQRAEQLRKLDWANVVPGQSYAAVKPFWFGYRIALCTDGRKALYIEWRDNRTEELGLFADWHEAGQAAQADLQRRVDEIKVGWKKS